MRGNNRLLKIIVSNWRMAWSALYYVEYSFKNVLNSNKTNFYTIV